MRHPLIHLMPVPYIFLPFIIHPLLQEAPGGESALYPRWKTLLKPLPRRQCQQFLLTYCCFGFFSRESRGDGRTQPRNLVWKICNVMVDAWNGWLGDRGRAIFVGASWKGSGWLIRLLSWEAAEGSRGRLRVGLTGYWRIGPCRQCLCFMRVVMRFRE
jgi:hypothetical protein